MSPVFIPGSVDVAPEVLAAQARPMLSHNSKDFELILHRVENKLRQLFYTQYRVFIGTHSGSGMHETAVRNLVQENMLILVNGFYSERWCEIARANGKTVDRIDVPWGQVIRPEMLADGLKGKHYEAVAVVHNETSTGAENPVRELAAIVHELDPETLVLVDAVSSLGGAKIEMDAWGIDFLLTASQNAIGLPPGLAMAGASDRAMTKAEKVKNRGWYFDLVRLEKFLLKDATPMTPAIPLIYALDVQLGRILAEGLDVRFARHAAMAKLTQDWCSAHDMEPLPASDYRSKTVSTINNTRKMDIEVLNKFLEPRGMCLANGFGRLKDLTFRIAHMGEIQMRDVEHLLAGIEEYLNLR